jgi:hypothetical protein
MGLLRFAEPDLPQQVPIYRADESFFDFRLY